MYVLNPKKNINAPQFLKAVNDTTATNPGYSSVRALSSAFSSCFKKRHFFSYILQRFSGTIEKEAIRFDHFYVES